MRSNTVNISVGGVFGKLTVSRELTPYISPGGKKIRKFECRCECSNMTSVLMGHLRSGKIKSCGCIKQNIDKTRKSLSDIPPNTHFGSWKVIKEASPKVVKSKKHRMFYCRCKCGVCREVLGVSLRLGTSKGCGCDRLKKLKRGVKPNIYKDVVGRVYGNWTVLSEADSKTYDSGITRIVSAKCRCGSIKPVILQSLVNGSSMSCGCVCKSVTRSKAEQEIQDFIRHELNYKFPIIASDRSILKGLEIDLYLPQHKLGIEYHGLYWHSDLKQRTNTLHFRKRELAQKAGIQLIQIFEDEWLGNQELIKSMLRHLLGLNSIRYYARKLTIDSVGSKVAQAFLKSNHLMGTFQTGRNIGLYTKEGVLVQLFTYQLKKEKHVLDCSRICSLKNTSVVGGVSRLLKHALRTHSEIQKIISFVDLRYATGNSLSVMGFALEKITLGFKWTDFKSTFNRLKCRANMDERKLTQAQHAEELGWFKLYDAGQAKFTKEIFKS